MSKFEQAEIYLKEVMSIPVEIAINGINTQLKNDRVVPGLKLIVTGGQAIQTYFPNSEPLRTHDYDLKLIAPKDINMNQSVKDRMRLLGRGATRYMEIALNDYVNDILPRVRRNIKDKFGLDLVGQEGKIFNASVNLRNPALNTVFFRLRDGQRVRANSMVDIYVVDPKEIEEHYYTFTGLEGSNPILSEDAGNYYIPFKYINDIPYAAMGYILWDTLRMVKNTRDPGSPKRERYKEKRDAIIQALNNPKSKMSCNAVKDFIVNCERTYNECMIRGKNFDTIEKLLRFGLDEGLIPPDREVIEKILDTYDVNYVCQSIKRML